MERLERYHVALDLLERGQVSEAGARFRALLEGGPESGVPRSAASGPVVPDPVVSVCLGKCREIEESGESWDGVWVLKSKG